MNISLELHLVTHSSVLIISVIITAPCARVTHVLSRSIMSCVFL